MVKQPSILIRLLLFCFLLFYSALPASAQNTPVTGAPGVPVTTVSGLSAYATKGQIAVVTNGSTNSDCATGGGATVVVCQYGGASWAAVASNGSMVYPLAGIPNSSGVAWNASYTVSGSGNVCLTTSCIMTTPNLGTPSAATLTNATGLPIAGITGLGTGIGTFLATPTSANFAAAITDETGTGAVVLGTTPTLTAPIINFYTVAGLPAAATVGRIAIVTNGTSATDCTVGGGSSLAWCRDSGTAWAPISAAGGGSGTVNSGTQYAFGEYATAGTAISSGPAPPTVNGIYECGYTVTGGVAVAPTCPLVGLLPRAITGVATTDTILYSDNGNIVEHDVGASGAVTETLPTAITLGNAHFAFSYVNHSAQTDTITPTTWTIQKGTANATSNISVPPGYAVRIEIDPNLGTNWLADAYLDPANIITAASAASAAKQTCVSGGATKTCSYIDFPDSKSIPFAICVNGTAATGVTTTTTVGGTCRAGTNNKDAYVGPFTTSDSATFKIHLPKDWDTATAPSLSVDLASTDTTSGHTVILQAATECSKLDGTTTDDVAFNTAQSMGTVTLNTTAGQTWTATLASLTTTGCAAPGIMWVKITRTTDTATNVGLYEADVTIPRLLTVQAN